MSIIQHSTEMAFSSSGLVSPDFFLDAFPSDDLHSTETSFSSSRLIPPDFFLDAFPTDDFPGAAAAAPMTASEEANGVLGEAGLLASKKIQQVVDGSVFFKNIPDIGMDRFLVSKGEPLGTCGLGPCFAVCCIGKTHIGTPVLALCHKSSLNPFRYVFQRIKCEMIDQEGAEEDTIESYVIGGQLPSEMSPEGTIAEEEEVTSMMVSEGIKEVLFNQTLAENEEDALSIVVTPEKVYVSNNPLFPEEGKDVGISLFDDE